MDRHWLLMHLRRRTGCMGAFGCLAIIIVDEIMRPQQIWIMNAVWPVTAMFRSLFGLRSCFKYGWLSSKGIKEKIQA